MESLEVNWERRAGTWNSVGYDGPTTIVDSYSGEPHTFTHRYAKHCPGAEKGGRGDERPE